MNRLAVMHLVDTLALGGAEAMAVHLANAFPPGRYQVYLCATRRGGPLQERIQSHVEYLNLGRWFRFDIAAIARLAAFVRSRRIRILHAHGTAVFAAAAASVAADARLVWHDHQGMRCTTGPSPAYRLLAKRLDAVIAVTRELAGWTVDRLGFPAGRTWYLPNFVPESRPDAAAPDLPGTQGYRIVQVANLRPQKDHANMIRAMREVVRSVPQAHLLLVGSTRNAECVAGVQQLVRELGLGGHITILGERRDVAAVLAGCDIGVLSSASEGLPLALLEYGMAGLPVVATRAGECAEVLDGGRAGLLAAPGDPVDLAGGLIRLLENRAERADFAARFERRVRENFSANAAVGRICEIYDGILRAKRRAA